MSYNNVGHLIISTIITLQHFATLHYPLIWLNPATFPIVLFIKIYEVKVQFTLVQATKVQRDSRGIALLSLTSTLDGVGGQHRALAALPLGKRPAIGDWVGSRASLERCRKSHPPQGFDPRTVQPVASATN